MSVYSFVDTYKFFNAAHASDVYIEETCWKNNGQREGGLKNWSKTAVKIEIKDDMISGF